MTALAPPAPATTWTEAAVTDLVLELLAGLLGEDRTALESRLIAGGAAMPVDSLDLMDIVAEFRQRTGLRIPKRKLRRHHMKSVRSFARFVSSEATP